MPQLENFIARQFNAPARADVDAEIYRNALSRNEVARIPQYNKAQDLGLQAAEQEISQRGTEFTDQQKTNARMILSHSLAAIAQSSQPKMAAQQFFASPDFQAAGQLLGLPLEQFTVTDQDTDDVIRAGAIDWSRGLGGAVEQQEQYEQIPGENGDLYQRNLGTNQYTVLRGRDPQASPQPGGPRPPSGYEWVYMPDGSVGLKPIVGGPADPNRAKPSPPPKAPAATDKRNLLMFGSMVNAEQQIRDMQAFGNKTDTSSLPNAALGGMGLRIMQSDEYKQYEAAGLRWAANQLYLKSGATATPDEIQSTWKQYFPQPGEGPEVADQKNAARLQEMISAGQITGGQVPQEWQQTQQGGWSIRRIQ